MVLPFPEQTVSQRSEAIQSYLDSLDKRGLTDITPLAESLFDSFSKDEGHYGFHAHLSTGNYTPYGHERREQRINTFNCTTVIPEIFIDYHLVGLNPEIVQFFNFQTLEEKEDREKPAETSHFALTFDLHGSRYLCDPFFHLFGPIRHQDEHQMIIRNKSSNKKVVRKFEKLLEVTPESFHNLMMRMRKPEHSLEMLIAGQLIFPKSNSYEGVSRTWVYYNDELNRLSTRLYLDSSWISDKALFMHQDLDDEGKVKSRHFELYYAKDFTWNYLVSPMAVARFSKYEMQQLKHLYHDLLREGEDSRRTINQRLGVAFAQEGRSETKTQLLHFAESMMTRLSHDEREDLQLMLLSRTLYECSVLERDYLSTQKERDDLIVEEGNRFSALSTEGLNLYSLHGLIKMGVLSVDPRIKRINNQRTTQINKEMEKADLASSFGWVKKQKRSHYDQVLDLVLYATKEVNHLSLEQLESKVTSEGLDTRIGYLAMVRDFLFFLDAGAMFNLSLSHYLPDLCSRVKARRQYLAQERT